MNETLPPGTTFVLPDPVSYKPRSEVRTRALRAFLTAGMLFSSTRATGSRFEARRVQSGHNAKYFRSIRSLLLSAAVGLSTNYSAGQIPDANNPPESTPYANALGSSELKPSDIPNLLKELDDKNEIVRLRAVNNIHSIVSQFGGNSLFDPLIPYSSFFKATKDGSLAIRLKAIETLGLAMSPKGGEELFQCYFRRSLNVSEPGKETTAKRQELFAIIKALSRIGRFDDSNLTEWLIRRLKSEGDQTIAMQQERRRIRSIYPLYQKLNPYFIQEIMMTLPNQVEAAWFLGDLNDRSVIPHLRETLIMGDALLKRASALALTQLGDLASILPPMTENPDDPESAALLVEIGRPVLPEIFKDLEKSSFDKKKLSSYIPIIRAIINYTPLPKDATNDERHKEVVYLIFAYSGDATEMEHAADETLLKERWDDLGIKENSKTATSLLEVVSKLRKDPAFASSVKNAVENILSPSPPDQENDAVQKLRNTTPLSPTPLSPAPRTALQPLMRANREKRSGG